ncbi:helix-turn-helix transcriptional regulator [Celeribacter persicus]|uniref:WYL domain-containing protein n=1 Tax=Celeribacter persicus TaxID=1651082 RepID=A0A2T5HSN1_9RHOB|nr:YafY family protein [Celeribacter persicus]PTQ74551.1 WYL domain-containing protein [Celeribacter persicus]
MAKSDRLFRLMHLLRSLHPPVTAGDLAQELGVSQRTLYRDIDALRACGARIEGEAGFGYTLTEDYALPPQSLTQIEIEALVLGLSEVRLRGDPALSQAARDALAKITASLPEEKRAQIEHSVGLVHRYLPQKQYVADLSLIRQACWEERALRLFYRDRQGRETRREIWPLAIVYLDEELMLLAHCRLRGAFRQFLVGSILSLEWAKGSFRPRRVPMLRDYISELRTRHAIAPYCEDGRRIMREENLTAPL